MAALRGERSVISGAVGVDQEMFQIHTQAYQDNGENNLNFN